MNLKKALTYYLSSPPWCKPSQLVHPYFGSLRSKSRAKWGPTDLCIWNKFGQLGIDKEETKQRGFTAKCKNVDRLVNFPTAPMFGKAVLTPGTQLQSSDHFEAGTQ